MSATAQERHVALYSILVDGNPIDERLARRVREVRVVNYLRLPDMCTLTASFPRGTKNAPASIDEHPFAVGSHLEIKLGARAELTTTTLFEGDVVSLDVQFGPGSIELAVRGFDGSHVLQRSRNVRTFQNHTASDIVEKILREADLDYQTDSSGDPHDFVQQDNETDWDFIWRLAERIGFEFVIQDGLLPAADQRRTSGRARMAEKTSLLQPPSYRDPTGQEGHARRPRPQDQGGDRRDRP